MQNHLLRNLNFVVLNENDDFKVVINKEDDVQICTSNAVVSGWISSFCIRILSTSIIALLLRMHDPDWLTDLTDFSSVMSKSHKTKTGVRLRLWKKPSHLRFSGRALEKKVEQIVDLSSFVCIRWLVHQIWQNTRVWVYSLLLG